MPKIDPPMHRLYHNIVIPHFTPAALNPIEVDLRARARIDRRFEG
jgi:hypothetical protein